MPELTEAGYVETRPDGTKVFTHGHRFPDNTQVITQEYGAQGQLLRAKVEWTGFAGKVLDVTATFGAQGELLKEEGFRAPGMTTPVKELLKPLPARVDDQEGKPAGPSAAPELGKDQAAAPAPVSLREGLERIYGRRSE